MRGISAVAICAVALSASSAKATPTNATQLKKLGKLRMSQPIIDRKFDQRWLDRRSARGETETVIVRLADNLRNMRSGKAQQSRMKTNMEMQASFMDRSARLPGRVKVIASVHHVMNAVFLEIDRKLIPQLADDPMVERIAPVSDYELDLWDQS